MTDKEHEKNSDELSVLNEIKYSVAGIRKIIVIQFIIQLVIVLIIWGSIPR